MDAGQPARGSAERNFSLAEMARLSGVPGQRLRRWDRSGLLPAARGEADEPRYVFRDVVTARTAVALLGAGVRPAQVRRAVAALRAWRPELSAPLASMRVYSEGGQLLVQVDGSVMEPVSGQLVLALPSGELSGVTARPGRVVGARPGRDTHPWTAQAAFEAGLQAEISGDARAAELHYQTALDRDPDHPGALLNLGNVLYRSGELQRALTAYRGAVRVADAFPEAHYNLANALDDLGQADAAIAGWKAALHLAPDFKAAHFNLALAWEKQGQRDLAREHWTAYVHLEPEGESADVARSFLSDVGDTLD